MAGSFPLQNSPGIFVPTTNVWDVQQLYELNVNSKEFKELLVRLYQNINKISITLNLKTTGVYQLTEYINGDKFFPNPATIGTSNSPLERQVFRLVINFGALPNAATKSVAHGLTITSGFTFTDIYATASDTAGMSYIPIPYASPTLNQNISINVDAANVNITTGINRTNYTTTYVVLEYIKS